MRRTLFCVALSVWATLSAVGAEEDPQAPAEAAIRKAVESYVVAFNKGDGKALAALWSPEGVYTNPISGEQVVGRKAIEEQFSGIFAESKGVKLEAKTESIQFVSPNVAVERGTAKVIWADQEPADTEYSAVYIQREGAWLLDRVTEVDIQAVPSGYENLKELEWMIGKWIDQDGEGNIETTCDWTKNQNFMTRSFTVSIDDQVDLAGMQIVGWDAAAKRIRSWVFDSDGGFGEGVWSKKGQSWYIETNGTLPDGGKSSATNVITYVDENTFTWQSINRHANGELLPNVDEVIVVRDTSN